MHQPYSYLPRRFVYVIGGFAVLIVNIRNYYIQIFDRIKFNEYMVVANGVSGFDFLSQC